ncbi:MAG: endoribonuclease MazF [Deltaproteobacteria bacterium]|nr:endoribonuclease MazF [Deltaproteobacteria bacterium]MBT6499931.1 endoribonuclease MazF [Deltaproteobacteria bacterium]MBT6612803.1 endoribonuclease MazF [Deltaproteobacteria bacterium]MBT7153390.1 endoribonuclease MazF [Deltaproteobacteria bacterium]
MTTYVPSRGDLVWINFNPQVGHERAGRRPALILSPANYNSKVGLAFLCPITSKIKGYPFEVALPQKLSVNGVILSDQVKNLDWKSKNVEFIGKLNNKSVDEVLQRLHTLL